MTNLPNPWLAGSTSRSADATAAGKEGEFSGAAAVALNNNSALAPTTEIDSARCCPTCGAALQDQFSWDLAEGIFLAGGVAVRLTRLEARIFDALWRKRLTGGIRDQDQFMSLVYGGDPDGGPEQSNVLSVHIAHIRRRLAPTGYEITRSMGRPRKGWRLAKIGDGS